MSTIRDIPSAWRDKMMPAHFDGNLFHVESGSRESGRRVHTHQFPHKELPYSEDLGRHAVEWAVRGYCIVYPHDDPNNPALYRRDYRIARDLLQARLDAGGSGILQLPTMAPMRVLCTRYRMTEEEKYGGYCTFDMQFVERGVQPFKAALDTEGALIWQANMLKQQVQYVWANQDRPLGPFTRMELQGPQSPAGIAPFRQIGSRGSTSRIPPQPTARRLPPPRLF